MQYRAIGGTLDFYFFSGPSPQKVVEQYGALVGLPTWQPYWGFGFHLCRWGYTNLTETRAQVSAMRAAGIPLETMWNDIDLYHAFRDFTTDPVSFPSNEVRDFIQELVRTITSTLTCRVDVLTVVWGAFRPQTTSTTSRSSTLLSLSWSTIRML